LKKLDVSLEGMAYGELERKGTFGSVRKAQTRENFGKNTNRQKIREASGESAGLAADQEGERLALTQGGEPACRTKRRTVGSGVRK